ncbi:hypothetical protein HanPI659440_Chr11g0415221 [Helianthus annuus]|nr:hypothetical protein HanPI659440_Chr11g0415221 [Helianthus annuus]
MRSVSDNSFTLDYGVWGGGWVQTPKSPSRVGLGFGVAPWAGVSARALGGPSGLPWPALIG